MKRYWKQAILVMLTLVNSPVALGEPWQVIEDGPYHIVLPKPPLLTLSRDNAAPVPDCAALAVKMRRWKRAIERCSNVGSQPETYCKLLREDLRRSLKGIINEPFGRFEAEASQTWQLDFQVSQVKHATLNKYATNNGLASRSVRAAAGKLNSHSQVALKLSTDSYSRMLVDADVLHWSPHFTLSTDRLGNSSLVTKDKLTACELLSGQIKLAVVAEVQLNYQVILDLQAGEARWALHQELTEATRAVTDDQRRLSLIAGYYFGRYLSINSSEIPSDSLLQSFAKVHLDISPSQTQLAVFREKFSFFQRLPQSNIARVDSFTIEAEVKNESD